MPDLTQPDWPLRITTLPDGTVQFADVIQGTPGARMADAAVVIATPKGHRDDDPNFGITELPFQTGALDLDQLVAELAASDPSLADLSVDEAATAASFAQRNVRISVQSEA